MFQFESYPHIGEIRMDILVYEKGGVIKHIKAPARVKATCLITRLESLVWSQQGFWQLSLCTNCDLWSLCFDGGNSVVLLCIAFLEERENYLHFFSYPCKQSIGTLVLPSQQRLNKLCFLQKLACQKPCWDQARLSSLVNKQVGPHVHLAPCTWQAVQRLF